jgi:hypothetical protein
MIAIPLLAALLMGLPQDSSDPNPPPASVTAPRHFTPEHEEQIRQKLEQVRIRHEPERREAIRMNGLAANIHSEADARKLVDAVAEQLTHHRHLFWAGQHYRHRVAHAEYEAVSDPSKLIPEQRIVDVWNEYVREIDAPEEALVSTAELHNLRAAKYLVTSSYSWKRDLSQSIWTMPNVYALDADGQLANGCRALEALRIIYEMHQTFANVRFARQRVEKGISMPDFTTQPSGGLADGQGRTVASAHLVAAAVDQNPILPAMFRYQREHGVHAYDQMIRRLFDELFPTE